ncbi:carboxyl transferase domain-containing protein [Paraburkholderia oxyphila]|uniref:carboxyl transferase domain-containing protein n=1 Tax=Paraburkholderia oxyphila TaxID=614212 RepID=UPI000482B0FF|nr:carboxyl transferase domain-containing protein [Paraburkholderia oxyphila]
MTLALFKKVLVANRGEVALRIVRALRELGVASVAIHADDDAHAPHVRAADAAVALGGTGAAAYLDGVRLIAIAREHGCDAVHPGYGFLSERADFASACATAGLRFIGPTVEQLALFGDKARSRALAQRCDVPVTPGSQQAVTLDEALAFFTAQYGAGVMIKAIGGGGGRGMRAVMSVEDLPTAYERCRSEAKAAFGVDGVYVERLMTGARHIEIQIVGDGDAVLSLGERECTLQRRFQKLVEIAPSPSLSDVLRQRIVADALRMARDVRYEGLGTFEFLVDQASADLPYVFIEANPRLQVEHTITEEVTGIDLVQTQIAIAAGGRLSDLGLDADRPPAPHGFAIQWRINAETLDAHGNARPGSGTLTRFDLPAGPGIRVDTHGVAGGEPSPHYDTLLAKLVVHTRGVSFDDALRRSQRALAEFRIAGVATNLPLLRALAADPAMGSQNVHTRWLEAALPVLVDSARAYEDRSVECDRTPVAAASEGHPAAPEHAVLASMPARVVQLSVSEGDVVAADAELGVLESMKMELLLRAPHAGRVTSILAAPGSYLTQGQAVLVLEPVDVDGVDAIGDEVVHDPDRIRADLQKVIDRHARTLDAARPDAVEKRHARGGRTARENIADLCDDGSFIEYGALAVAAQRSRRTLDDLTANTPADGIVTGIGTVNGALFGAERARTTVMSYDATVLAGTQGYYNHAKTDRMLELSLQQKLPVVLFAEGGGGRPGDVDSPMVAGLYFGTFASYAALSGQVPVVGITSGRCFAGNAALLGCSDVIIATRNSNIGMSGPAMIEGGGLGVFTPEQIGPSQVQHANGVIDVLVDDEHEAVAAARRYLGFFQGATTDWRAPDQRTLRHVVPENRLRVYDTRAAITGLVDEDSLLMLRTGFGTGIHTALARIEGRPVGLIANNPLHLGGAIDADAADKAARFMQLCNAHGLPIVSLVDTPGFMVGPDVEATAQVRHVSRLFVIASHLRVPCFSVVLRKGYGLGAMGMTAGGFHAPVFTISWPTGEFGGMGLEGAVRLGFRKELDALPAGPERDALFDQLLARQYERGAAVNMAMALEIDAVVDPVETRAWLVRGLASAKTGKRVMPFVDTW